MKKNKKNSYLCFSLIYRKIFEMTITSIKGETCLADSASTHTVLNNEKYLFNLVLEEDDVHTISGKSRIIEGYGRANILLPKGTKLKIEMALYSPKSRRNLLNFKDIRSNGYHIETMNEKGNEYLYVTTSQSGKKNILEKLPVLNSGLYYTMIKAEVYTVVNQGVTTEFNVWHDRLGHPGTIMMRKIIEN